MRFSGCMRSHGVTDFPDPTVGSNGLPSWTFDAGNVNPQSPAFQAAHQVCKNDLPDLLHTSAQKAAANAAALKYATCMRSHGVPNFPDPNGRGVIQVNSSAGIDQSSPAFQKAEAACKSLDNGFGEQSTVARAGSSPPGGAGGGS